MTQQELFIKYKRNTERIKELMNTSQFVLNPEISFLLDENSEINKQAVADFGLEAWNKLLEGMK